MAMVSSIFEVLNDKIQEHGVNRVVQVKLVVGDMTGVEDMTMKACFEIFAEATPVEGAQLMIEHVPIRARCSNCSNEFAVKRHSFQCPDCGSINAGIVSGKELYIESIEAE